VSDAARFLVGGPEPGRIVLAAPDPAWPARFAAERARIVAALGPVALRVEHIGSTSVPGLAAKPIVDVLVVVADPAGEDAVVAPLEAAGYVLRVREPGHRMLRTPAHDVHVHVWAEGDPEVERYLCFRDRLRASPEARARYEARKRELAQRAWDDVNDYADAKSEVVEAIIAAAGGPLKPPG
jgi:GrpB-like predicted nucleotidyltransferase (UPF0157 family)